MKRRPLRALLPVAALLVAGAGSPASAQVSEVQYTPWVKMHANANPPGADSLRAQCLRSRMQSGWTANECLELWQAAKAGNYELVSVPDGTRYDTMTGAHNTVSSQKRKQLGSNTLARGFTTSSGKPAHWYTDFAGACNNLGTNPRMPTPATVFMQSQVVQQTAPSVVHIPKSHYPHGCWCGQDHSHGLGHYTNTTPDRFITIPGSTITTSGGWTN